MTDRKLITISERLGEHIRTANLKSSSQREEILKVLYNSGKHLTAEELYENCKAENPGIGIATVYRALKLLCEIGICRELRIDRGITRYEVADGESHHDHLICTGCGAFVEVVSQEIERIQERIASAHGFKLESHRLNLYGLCARCRKK
jgi:Fur family transcriptional regulator, ferric uptake regulator